MPDDFVFCGTAGRPLHHRNVQRRGMDEAVDRAKFNGGQRAPTMHDLRHTFASLLIAQGLDVVFVSRQLGHANPATTLRVYASEFDPCPQRGGGEDRAVGRLWKRLWKRQPETGRKTRSVETAQVSQIRG